MILVALGANLPGPWGTPGESLARALAELDMPPLKLIKASRLIVTKPYGVENQPDFVNAVAVIETTLAPDALLRHLHEIERQAGRRREARWGPRTLDLDILDIDGLVRSSDPILPHPGIADRRFVLEPIAEIAPDWRHPVTHQSARELLAALH